MRTKVKMPRLGPDMDEGVLLEWHVQVGGQVRDGEPLATIETDKVDTELPSPVTGTVVELLAETGETVPIGTVIAVLDVEA